MELFTGFGQINSISVGGKLSVLRIADDGRLFGLVFRSTGWQLPQDSCCHGCSSGFFMAIFYLIKIKIFKVSRVLQIYNLCILKNDVNYCLLSLEHP